MDCCEFRGAGAGAPYGAGWPVGYAPSPYAPYAHYYPPAHDPYRYYRYDYAHHAPLAEHHIAPMDYGAYASKEARVRRAIARRDARALTPSHHLPLPHTPPVDCGMNGRGPAYGEPQMWPHYQMGLGGTWSGANAMSAAPVWAGRGACGREHVRYSPDYRGLKNSHHHAQSPMCIPEGRSTPYPMYDESSYESSVHNRNTPEFPAAAAPQAEVARVREHYVEPKPPPPEEKRPPIVPLPAFQQAFGSTEIGKFAEAFSRAEVAHGETASEYAFEPFPDWDATSDQQWPPPPAQREIKCEDNY